MLLAKSEQNEYQIQLLDMLSVEAGVIFCYKARLEYLGIWDLFLSLAGFGL